MNIFQAEHWIRRYQHITPCSPEHPYERNLRGGKISFKDPKKLLKFLKCSSDAEYMWTDSEDLAIIADMYQVQIKVITVKGCNDVDPTVNWIYPDVEMKEFAELKNVELDTMVLLHEDDSHFNLIISGKSDLAQLGSLSYRFNVGPTIKDGDSVDDNIEDEEDFSSTNETVDVDIKTLKKELKETKKSMSALETEYLKCEHRLRNKTEELEILKTE